MKTDKRIFIAFILNLAFSAFEIVGGIVTGSTAILSDAVHDAGDAVSIGISYLFERISRRDPDEKYTFGYSRFSLLGALITAVSLIAGSTFMIYRSFVRIICPASINYSGMIVLAAVGISVNLCAAFLTRSKDSINGRAVNLHMMEDVLGWTAVLTGAVVMKFTEFSLIDPLISIGVSVFILVHAIKNAYASLTVFLEKVPNAIHIQDIRASLCSIDGITDVHHLHIWSLDGTSTCATLHAVTSLPHSDAKARIRERLEHAGISHVTVELECLNEQCSDTSCHGSSYIPPTHSHCHHH